LVCSNRLIRIGGGRMGKGGGQVESDLGDLMAYNRAVIQGIKRTDNDDHDRSRPMDSGERARLAEAI